MPNVPCFTEAQRRRKKVRISKPRRQRRRVKRAAFRVSFNAKLSHKANYGQTSREMKVVGQNGKRGEAPNSNRENGYRSCIGQQARLTDPHLRREMMYRRNERVVAASLHHGRCFSDDKLLLFRPSRGGKKPKEKKSCFVSLSLF